MQCIGVDVSKQELVTYDGVRGQTFPNDKQLDKFTEYLNSVEHVVVVFEPTSTYSHRLQAFCARRSISICQLNPRVVPNLRKASRRRSKTDKTDAELLYQYGMDRGKDEAREAKQVDWLGTCTVCAAGALPGDPEGEDRLPRVTGSMDQ